MKFLDTKYRYFKKKLVGMRAMIWDLEFKRFKTFYVREQIRQEYDQLRSKLEILRTEIKAQKDKPSKTVDEIKRLEDEDIKMSKETETKIEQMKQLDIEVFGSKQTEQIPEGHQGLNETMEALRELVQVTDKYMKDL